MSTVANRNQVYQQAPALLENMLEKIGEVTGLATANSKRLITTRTTDEITSAVELLASKKLSNKVELSDSVLPTIDAQNGVWYAGKLLTTTLKAKSKTIAEAAEWYRSEIDKLDGMIDKKLTVKAQIEQAEKLAQILMDSAAASLYDKSLAATLREAFVRPSVEKLTNELTGYGSVLQAKILKEVTKPVDETLKWFEYGGACFAAGTLVHTKEGLVPIEQIKVDDLVLSKPESGEGEQAYKRVTQTFAHAPERVIEVMYFTDESQPILQRQQAHPIVTTMNHPFWVVGQGWTAAKDVRGVWSGDHQLELCDDRQRDVYKTRNIYISDQPGVGWVPCHDISTAYPGALWDYMNHRLVATEVPALKDFEKFIEYEDFEEGEDADSFFLKLPVYNLEVEDFHTYYVGEHGVWVHNKNGNGLEFTVRGKLTQLTDEQPFLSRLELEKYLIREDKREGTFLIPAGSQSQAGLMNPDEWQKWLKHEENVAGRLVASDGSRWEYAVVVFDNLANKLNIIGVEGRGLSKDGLPAFIDSKLVFVKAGKEDEALRVLERAAMYVEANLEKRWVFEFEQGIIIDEKVGLRKARALFEQIRSHDPNAPKFLTDGYLPDGTPGRVEDVARMDRIRFALGIDEAHSLIELRNAPLVTPQYVTAEGNLTDIPALTLAQINILLPQARQYWLDAGASAAVLNRATFAIADLPFGMAGQTANNVITFDTLGAGWGWYVDATPADPSEFQATVQATVFAANSTSEASNKLDLLTVLIHELGHVAGLLHAAAENDVMSQYLIPGERRLPDAVDMAVLQTQGAPFYVGNTTSTWVTLPTAAVFANALNTQMQTAFTTNPILTNGSFNNADGWSTQGGVDIANGAAVLREVSNSQTRLSQVFRLKLNDHFLGSTLSGAALDDMSGAHPIHEPRTFVDWAKRSVPNVHRTNRLRHATLCPTNEKATLRYASATAGVTRHTFDSGD